MLPGMSKRTVVLVFCDMPHDDEVPAETVVIEADRATTEVDLCEPCRQDKIGPLVRLGRTVKRPGRKPAARS